MLATLGFVMMVTFVVAVCSGRCSALVGLIAIPILFGLVGGFAPELPPMMLKGVEKVAPTGVMLMFAILYFAVMIEAGLFDPIIRWILKLAQDDPLKIVVGTAALAMVAALDGDGTTTYMITASALFPLYQRLKMNPLVLSSVAMLAFGVMNMTPWGGPMARAVTALDVRMQDVFVPLVPVMGVGLAWTFLVAYVLGRGERRRLAAAYGDAWAKVLGEGAPQPREYPGPRSGRRGSLALNALVTLGLMAGLLTGALPLPVLFMVAFAVALVLNHPHPSDQKALLTKHAGNVIMVVVLVFASGIFTGILSGTKMVDEMATSLIRLIPAAFGEHFAVITALSSLVFTYFMANDPYYYGVLPVIAKTAAGYGVEPVQIARASILGMPMHAMSPLMAATYLLLGITGVEFSAHQRFVFRWAAGSSLVMIAAAVVFAAIDA